MKVEEIAAEMREVAQATPLDPMEFLKGILEEKGGDPAEAFESVVKMMEAGTSFVPMENFQRSFVLDGLELKVTLTLDVMLEKKGWHVSFGTQWGDTDISDDLCLKLLPIFLPLKYRPFELPSTHGPRCRQFLEPIE